MRGKRHSTIESPMNKMVFLVVSISFTFANVRYTSTLSIDLLAVDSVNPIFLLWVCDDEFLSLNVKFNTGRNLIVISEPGDPTWMTSKSPLSSNISTSRYSVFFPLVVTLLNKPSAVFPKIPATVPTPNPLSPIIGHFRYLV